MTFSMTPRPDSLSRPAEPRRVPLTQLKRGDRATLELKDLSAHETQLLGAMGLSEHCEVRVCRAGTPCIVQIEATRLGIAADVAAKIVATPCECYPEGGQHHTSRLSPLPPRDDRENKRASGQPNRS